MTRLKRDAIRVALCLCAAAPILVVSGCYERVVAASGPNADAYDLYEPNDPNQQAKPREVRRYKVPNAVPR